MPWVKKKKKEKKTSLNGNKHNTLENEAIEKLLMLSPCQLLNPYILNSLSVDFMSLSVDL